MRLSKRTGATIDIADGSWDLTLPNGQHRRGQCDTPEEAEAEANVAYLNWLVAAVERGKPRAGQLFVFPLG